MATRKLSLDSATEAPSGFVLGVISPEKSYKLAWRINELIDIDLVKMSNWLPQPPYENTEGFDQYTYYDDLRKADYFLLRNKQNGYVASKAYARFDFILFIFGDLDSATGKQCYEQLRQSAAIISVAMLDINISDIKF